MVAASQELAVPKCRICQDTAIAGTGSLSRQMRDVFATLICRSSQPFLGHFCRGAGGAYEPGSIKVKRHRLPRHGQDEVVLKGVLGSSPGHAESPGRYFYWIVLARGEHLLALRTNTLRGTLKLGPREELLNNRHL